MKHDRHSSIRPSCNGAFTAHAALLISAFALTSLCALDATAQGNNLVPNPGFEDGASCYGFFPTCSSNSIPAGQSIAPWTTFSSAPANSVVLAYLENALAGCTNSPSYMFQLTQGGQPWINPASSDGASNNHAYALFRQSVLNPGQTIIRGVFAQLSTPMCADNTYTISFSFNSVLVSGGGPATARTALSFFNGNMPCDSVGSFAVSNPGPGMNFTINGPANNTWTTLTDAVTGIAADHVIVWVQLTNNTTSVLNVRVAFDNILVDNLGGPCGPGMNGIALTGGAVDHTLASPMRSVNLGASSDHLIITPNPTSGAFDLFTSGLPANLPVQVIAADGRLVRSLRTKDSVDLHVDLSGEPAGLYMINIEQEGKVLSQRVVKE